MRDGDKVVRLERERQRGAVSLLFGVLPLLLLVVVVDIIGVSVRRRTMPSAPMWKPMPDRVLAQPRFSPSSPTGAVSAIPPPTTSPKRPYARPPTKKSALPTDWYHAYVALVPPTASLRKTKATLQMGAAAL